MYFYLSSHCILVEGTYTGAIYDMKEEQLYALEKDEFDALVSCQSGNEIQAPMRSFFETLESNKLGFYWHNKCFVDPVRLYNKDLFTKLDAFPMEVNCLTLKLNDQCSAPCDLCQGLQCPLCTKGDSKSYIQEDIAMSIVHRLMKMGLSKVIITGGNPLQAPSFNGVVKVCLEEGLKVQVITHVATLLTYSLPEGIDIHILVTNISSNIKRTIEKLKESDNITLFCYHKSIEKKLRKINKKVKVEYAPPITQIQSYDDLNTFTIASFYARRDTDDCLRGNVYINHQSLIVPCLHPKASSIGKVDTPTDLEESLQRLFKDYWYKAEKNLKCQSCELYNACSLCRYCDAEVLCNYSPDKGKFVMD